MRLIQHRGSSYQLTLRRSCSDSWTGCFWEEEEEELQHGQWRRAQLKQPDSRSSRLNGGSSPPVGKLRLSCDSERSRVSPQTSAQTTAIDREIRKVTIVTPTHRSVFLSSGRSPTDRRIWRIWSQKTGRRRTGHCATRR